MSYRIYFSHIMCYLSCFIISIIGLICSIVLLNKNIDQKNIYIVFITVSLLFALISFFCFSVFLIKECRKENNQSEFDKLISNATKYDSYVI
jgi:phosphotransferase system  glucose/maltose/N-acetylglucosamine-specific IIC component